MPGTQQTGVGTAMTAKTHSTPTVYRAIRFRLLPGTKARARYLSGLAGANRFVWNHWVARFREHRRRLAIWHHYRIGPKPKFNHNCFHTFKEFTQLQCEPEYAWLKKYSVRETRYSLKYLQDAIDAYYRQPECGLPKFKSRYTGNDGFTISDNVKLQDGNLWVPKLGWVQLGRRNNPYTGCQPVMVRVTKDETGKHPRWYAHIVFEVPEARMQPAAQDGALGVDFNAGQYHDSDGVQYDMPDTSTLDVQIERKQRELSRKQGWGPKTRGHKKSNRGRRVAGQLRKLNRKRGRRRKDAVHQISRELADTAATIVIEDLKPSRMSRSAKGTVEEPGRNVKAKTGLNRAIRESNWSTMRQFLIYKCADVVAVNPRYTSQQCHRCGYTSQENRRTQADFACRRCGLRMNADHNAALNILERGLPGSVARGEGASARRGAIPLGTPTTREHGMLAVQPSI